MTLFPTIRCVKFSEHQFNNIIPQDTKVATKIPVHSSNAKSACQEELVDQGSGVGVLPCIAATANPTPCLELVPQAQMPNTNKN